MADGKRESASVASIRGYDYKQYDENDDEYWKSALPYGGILTQGNTVKTGYTVRNGLSFVKVLADVHDMNIIVGSELRGTSTREYVQRGMAWTPTYGERFMPVHTDNFVNNYIDRMLPTNTNTRFQESLHSLVQQPILTIIVTMNFKYSFRWGE